MASIYEFLHVKNQVPFESKTLKRGRENPSHQVQGAEKRQKDEHYLSSIMSSVSDTSREEEEDQVSLGGDSFSHSSLRSLPPLPDEEE